MRNETFLCKAEDLKPALNHTRVVIDGDGRKLSTDDEVIFDFGDHYVGYVTIDFSSAGHHQDAPLYFQIQFAEIREELDQDVSSYRGWISKSWIQEEKIHIDALPISYTLERRYAFRYVRIKILSVSENYTVRIDHICADTVSCADYSGLSYPAFTKEDALLDKISIRTLHSCMQEVFEDGPKRDRRLWLGDLRLEALSNYQTFKNYNLVKRCLYLFAGTTLEEGRLSNNLFIYPSVECDYQTMFDYTIFFINTLWEYFEQTGDIETLIDLEPVCIRQYELLSKCFDEKDRIDMNKAGNVFVDWNFDLDKTASAQAIYICGMKDLLKIEMKLNKDCSVIRKEIAAKTKAALSMFDEEASLFVSGDQKQISYASQIWMILAGVTDRGKQILSALSRHEEAVGLNSPYAYHYYIQAMIDCGMKDEAYQTMHEYWGGMIAKGSNTFWEIYNPQKPDISPYGGIVVHSFCHAWSCTPAYFLRKYYY